jgi:hypothetical protein
MVRDFRADDRDFFARRRPGPASAPAKQAARAEVLRLRQAGHSITEITQALATTATPLNRTGVWELLRDEGFERLPTRPAHQRGTPRRDHPPRTRRIAWPPQPLRLSSDYAGVLLLVPGLVALDLHGAVRAARLPGHATATPDTIWRRFVSTSGQVTLGPTEVVARIAERTYSPVLRSADLPEVEVPWWDGRRLRFEIAVGKK